MQAGIGQRHSSRRRRTRRFRLPRLSSSRPGRAPRAKSGCGGVARRPSQPYSPCFTALPRAHAPVRDRAGEFAGRFPMFEGLQRNLGEALKRLRGRGRITESNIREGIAEVRKALLDADVNYNVVQSFIERVTQRSLGQAVLRTIDPSEQIVKIVYDELVALIGQVDTRI